MVKIYDRVFCAYDGNPESGVPERALELAHDEKAALCFGYVVDAATQAEGHNDFAQLAESVRPRIEESLAPFIKAAESDEDIPSVEVRIAAGPVAKTLVNGLIKPFDADAVVCGSRRLSNLQYAMLGSVSTYLVRNLRCDVLVVR